MKIYHYTSIQTLALILTSGKIKLNRLDNVDDLEESMYLSGKYKVNLSKYCFVSCWTKSREENIGLWKMYTDYRGVRIGLDEDMLVTFPHFGEDNMSYFKDEPHNENGCIISRFYNKPYLYDVIYENNADEKIRNFISDNADYISIATKDIGLYKRKEWYFQNECRFKLFGYPYRAGLNNPSDSLSMDQMLSILNVIAKYPLKQSELFLNIKPEKLDEIEVMLGPKTTEADEIIVKSLLSNFSRSRIVESYFRGKIK